MLTTAAANLRGLGDLAGKRIAIIPGTTTEKALAEFLSKEFISAFGKPSQTLQIMYLERVARVSSFPGA